MIKRECLVDELRNKSSFYIKFRAFKRLLLCIFWFTALPFIPFILSFIECIKKYTDVSCDYHEQWILAKRAVLVLFSQIERKVE